MKVSYRLVADVIAGVIAVAVAVTAVVVMASDSDLQGPKTTTTVDKEPVAAVAGPTKTTTVVAHPAKGKVSRTVTTETGPGTAAKPAETTVTTEEGQRTFLERLLGDGGVVILQVAVAVAAAFLAGAVVQRVLLGEYGGFKFGTFELSAVARASNEGITTLGEDLKKLREQVDDAVKAVAAESATQDAKIREDLAIAYKRIDLIDKKLDE